MPVETRQPSVAMTLHLVAPQTLYLYVEEQDVRKLAVSKLLRVSLRYSHAYEECD